MKAIRCLSLPDLEVKLKLRMMGHPICYFGENSQRRLERLKEKVKVYYRTNSTLPSWMLVSQNGDSQSKKQEILPAFTNQKINNTSNSLLEDPLLLSFRQKLTQESLKMAKKRNKTQKEQAGVQDPFEMEKKTLNELNYYRFFSFSQCHFADSSSISRGALSASGKKYATSSFSGDIKIWDPVIGKEIETLKGHIGQIVDIAFSSKDEDILASSGLDNSVRIWRNGKDIILGGHKDRVNRIGFGGGDFLVSGSHDKTIRVWDVNACKTVTMLNGHSAEIYATGFHPDGAIIVVSFLLVDLLFLLFKNHSHEIVFR